MKEMLKTIGTILLGLGAYVGGLILVMLAMGLVMLILGMF